MTGQVPQFYVKSTEESAKSTPSVIPAVIDIEICKLLHAQYDPFSFCCDWFTVIGGGILEGRNLGSGNLQGYVRRKAEHFYPDNESALMRVLEYLETNYTSYVVTKTEVV